jgi:hypothetical protein
MTTEFDTSTENTEAPEALGTIEYIDPETLEIGLSARECVARAHRPVRNMENAFATHRRRSSFVSTTAPIMTWRLSVGLIV